MCGVQMARDAQMSRRRSGPPGQSQGLNGSPPKYVYVLIPRTRIPLYGRDAIIKHLGRRVYPGQSGWPLMQPPVSL